MIGNTLSYLSPELFNFSKLHIHYTAEINGCSTNLCMIILRSKALWLNSNGNGLWNHRSLVGSLVPLVCSIRNFSKSLFKSALYIVDPKRPLAYSLQVNGKHTSTHAAYLLFLYNKVLYHIFFNIFLTYINNYLEYGFIRAQ